MKLFIPEPKHYFCQLDEDHFFGWLKEIDAVQDIKGRPEGLELVIDDKIDRTSLYELIGLLTRYDIDRTCLRRLCQDHPDHWFRDSKRYWHKDVFG